MTRAVPIALAIACVSLNASAARASDAEDFLHAQSAYQAGDFDVAVERFEVLVGGEVPRLTEPVYIMESRKLLGASYAVLGRTALASRQFELLLESNPDVRIDPVLFPAEVVELFNSIRDRIVEARLREAEEARRREEERRRREAERLLRERERQQRLIDLAASETVEVQSSRLLATVPFGAGQFQNGETTLGWALAISQGALAIGSIATFLIHQAIPRGVGNKQFEGTEAAVRISNWIVTSAFGALALTGIVQAHIAFVPARTETRDRDIPEDLRPPDVAPTAELRLGLGLAGAHASLSF